MSERSDLPSSPGVAARCLVVRRGGLGDTLLMTAVLRAIRRSLPAQTPLHFAGVADFAMVLQHARVVDRASSSEQLLAHDRLRCRERLADCTFVFADDRAIVAAAQGPVAKWFDVQPRHHHALPLQIAAQLGLTLRWPADHALPWPTVQARSGVLLAPGSGGRMKCWPRAGWLALATALRQQGERCAVLVGPVEQERDDPRRWPWPDGVTAVVPDDAIALGDTLAAAAAFVGNDSGPTHFAAQLGLPTVALFGPSDATVFAPVGPRVELVVAANGDLAQLTPDVVLAALAAARSRA